MKSRGTALIVDKQPDWQTIIGSTLHDMAWDYDIAATLADALELLQNNFYDVAVIDPNSGNPQAGVQAIGEIAALSPSTYLIVVSNAITPDVLHQHPAIPATTALLAKQTWDREMFRGMILRSTIIHNEMGGRTLLGLIRSSKTVKSKSQEMPSMPKAEDRPGVPRILIVDDQEEWQNILATTMEEEGWLWRTVSDAATALTNIRDAGEQYHVALLDLRLGKSDATLRMGAGWQLLDYLTRTDVRTRVVIVSGEASRGDVANLFMRYPIAGFIDKETFKTNELLELLYELTTTPEIRIQTLGNFRVWRDGQDIDDFGSEEAETFLQILLSRQQTGASNTELGKLLFGDPGATVAVEAVVNAVRRAFEPNLVDPSDSGFIWRRDNHYILNLDAKILVDFIEFESMLKEGKRLQGIGKRELAAELYEQARDLYEGEYLPQQRTAQWSVPVRNDIDRQAARLLNRLSDLYAEGNEFDKAIQTAEACLKIDAYHESTHRRLMRFHYCSGNKDRALVVYQTLEKLKREFFQEEPDAATQALRDAILADHKIRCVEQPS